MAFKEFLFCGCVLCFMGMMPSLYGGQVQDAEETLGGWEERNGPDYSGQTNAQLFEAERVLRKKLSETPAHADYYFELSNIYAVLFDRNRKERQSDEWLQRSGEALERAVMLDPARKIAHYNLGVVYKRQGRMEKAREQLKKCVRLCEADQEVYLAAASWFRIGETYEEQGFYEEAQTAYLKAREYDYGNQEIEAALARLRVKSKESYDGRSLPPFSLAPSMSGGPSAAGMVGDPSARNDQNQGIGQALPYLAQGLSQKFGGSQDAGGQD